MNLVEFLHSVHQRLQDAVCSPEFHSSQTELLAATVRTYARHAAANPSGDPLSLMYFILRAWERPIDEQVVEVSAFCALYLLSADLLDDVQDDDLAGKPHAHVKPAIAMNNAVALLFLGLRSLQRAIELEPSLPRQHAYLRLFNQTSVLGVTGQHRDLMGAVGALSPDEVLAMQQAKTSSVAMITELAALLSGCDEELAEHYRLFGQRLPLFLQIRDDLRDVYGKSISPDLATGKITYPVACFLEEAGDVSRQRFEELLLGLPETLGQIRTLLYQSGAVARSAATMEQFREEMHDALAATGNRSAAHRCLLSIIDGLAENIYTPSRIESTACFFEPEGPWHDWVRHNLTLFLSRMKPFCVPEAPTLRPWHLPQWMYDPGKKIIYYPDIEELGDEILPFQAELLGTDDLQEVSQILWEQVPAVLAHEMFHYWRDAAGCMTEDHWHEEWAANRLAVAYTRQYARDILAASVNLADRVLSRYNQALDDKSEQVLTTCNEPRPGEQRGYDMSLESMAIVTLEMVRRLALEKPDLAETVSTLLTQPEDPLEIVAA